MCDSRDSSPSAAGKGDIVAGGKNITLAEEAVVERRVASDRL